MIKKKLTAAVLALGISASLLFQMPVSATAQGAEQTSSIKTNAIPGWPQAADISSTAAVVMESSTKTSLFSKNANQPLYPSAAVKIMTTLVALENSQLTDTVTMTATGVSGVTDGGVNISAQLDETFTMEQCLYAIMVASANDIALQVAEHVGGSVEAFVEKMNARAKELGCKDTIFTNPTGLPDENQHTTAYDMALIMRAAMNNDTFRTIAAAQSYTIPATNVSGGERALTNKFTMTNTADPAYYQGCLGGKEGYTQASGSTLVCAASRNGVTLICVVLNGAAGVTDDEAISLLNYGYDNFGRLELPDEDLNRISGGIVFVPNGASADSLTFKDKEKGDKIRRSYYFGDTRVGTATLENEVAAEDTKAEIGEKNMKEAKDFSATRNNTMYYVIGGIGISVLLLLLFLMIRIIKS
ncbi:MAG: D-alanyl-D-alanine carboxypeptidase family protein [Eubacteriales bacterium]|nr:D-alanyl-D-alanine carboxypeptidase family protein [Eubacteriales bacterium]